ncbi:hypothetical protein F66182_15596, partial [Fusarium sp. NRRL 66182]
MAPVTEVDEAPKPVAVETNEKVHDSETSSSTQADVTGIDAPDAEKPSRHTHWTADNQTHQLEPTP